MKEVIVTVGVLYMPVSFIQLYKHIELVARYKSDYLGENILTLIHNLDVWGGQD